MNKKEIIMKIKEIVSDVSEVGVDEFNEQSDLVEDLEVDSMMALEILTTLEKQFQISIPQKELINFKNVDFISEIVEKYSIG